MVPYCARRLFVIQLLLSCWLLSRAKAAISGSFQHEIALAECGALRQFLALLQGVKAPHADKVAGDVEELVAMLRGYRRAEGECWSRAEWLCFHNSTISSPSSSSSSSPSSSPSPSSSSPRYSQPSPLLLRLLHRYHEHWHSCHAAENSTQLRDALLNGMEPACRYMLWVTPSDGMGNRLLNLVSAFAYALLTDRILLVDSHPTSVSELLCEPLADSPSWVFPFADDLTFGGVVRVANYSNCTAMAHPAPLVLSWDILHFWDLGCYFCDDYHAWADGAPVLMASGNQYYVPALYFVPRFRKALWALFPSGRVFATLAPLLLRPRNAVWARVTKFLLSHRNLRKLAVGVQFRKGHNVQDATAEVSCCLARLSHAPSLKLDRECRVRVSVNRRCALPDPAFGPLPLEFEVYVATMDERFVPELESALRDRGVAAAVYSLTSDRRQRTEDERHNERALLDITALALGSDLLFTSPVSTFGYIISGLSGAPAMFVESGCAFFETEPCFQAPPMNDVRCCGAAKPFGVQRSLEEVQGCPDSFFGITVRPRH